MPTENRSSNTEMVSALMPCPFCGEKPQITKHHREDIYSFMHRCPVLGPISWGFREDQQAHIEKWNARAQPAPQPHPEPIAWMVGTDFWWTKEEAERDAAATGLPIVGLGPITVAAFGEQHQDTPVGEVVAFSEGLHEIAWAAGRMPRLGAKLWTHADPVEVERLRDALRLAKHWCDAALNAIQMGSGNPDALNDVACLLRHMAKDLDSTAPASAEPSAPKYHRQSLGMDDAARDRLTLIAREAAISSTHRHSYMPTTPEDALFWEPHAWVLEAMRMVEPSAPVEIEERAEFEKAVIDKAERFHPDLRRYGDHPEAEYRDANNEWAWGLWQARAALERQP
ncbi:Lar family restriction alleviation protein [Pseudomonas monteilii]|uniref:Lar family restriction alleviation protein n=1 Tax=Pseudomonas monteilii TaxID=76759 RepID=UPI000760E669|nr:Lar family restriction alleviation protein [Pseudomonas monteilii]